MVGRQPLLVLGVVGAVLALVVGLVQLSAGKVERGGTHELPALSPLSQRAPTGSTLQVPTVLPPVASEPAPDAPAAAETKAAAAKPAAPGTAHLVGYVLRASGDPAKDARVVLGRQHARCDAEGRFEMTVGDAAGADLVAFEPGSEPAVRANFGAGLAIGGEFQVRLLLGPETLTLSGTVVDAEGHGLKNWTVELDGDDPLARWGLRERVRTDGEGRFELADVPAGTHVVRAYRESKESALRSEPTAAGVTDVRIVAP